MGDNRLNCDDLRRRVMGLFLAGLPGTELDAETGSLLRAGVRGGTLFDRNVETPTQIAALTHSIHEARGSHSLVAVDQEGGRVARLRQGFWVPPAMRTLGAADDPALCERVGRAVGRQLGAVGINLAFAPVLDVDTNPDNPVIGDRSLGRDPVRVAALGMAVARGLESAGVAACGKHFPGHGDTAQDSHLTLPRLTHNRNRLDRVELMPFRAVATSGEAGLPGVAAVMTAHVLFEAIDPAVPATMSPAVVTGLLRNELGYRGVVVSDDLEMGAIVERLPVGEAAVRAIAAGVDLVLICRRHDRLREAVDAVVAAVGSGRLPGERVDEASARIDRLAERFPLRSKPGIGDPAELIDETLRQRWDAHVKTIDGQDPTQAAATGGR
ncbi:MAG: beta-N-acetylhexosaminidase [Planctomycetota bacterium]